MRHKTAMSAAEGLNSATRFFRVEMRGTDTTAEQSSAENSAAASDSAFSIGAGNNAVKTEEPKDRASRVTRNVRTATSRGFFLHHKSAAREILPLDLLSVGFTRCLPLIVRNGDFLSYPPESFAMVAYHQLIA